MGFLDRALRDQFEESKPDVLQADIRMISGCEDQQTSADVSSVQDFQLPDPAGRAGGACTRYVRSGSVRFGSVRLGSLVCTCGGSVRQTPSHALPQPSPSLSRSPRLGEQYAS